MSVPLRYVFFFHNLVVYIHVEVYIFFRLVQMTTFSRVKMTEGFSECHLPISPKEPSFQCLLSYTMMILVRFISGACR